LPQVRRAVCLAAGDPDEQWWPTLRFVSRMAHDDVDAERPTNPWSCFILNNRGAPLINLLFNALNNPVAVLFNILFNLLFNAGCLLFNALPRFRHHFFVPLDVFGLGLFNITARLFNLLINILFNIKRPLFN